MIIFVCAFNYYYISVERKKKIIMITTVKTISLKFYAVHLVLYNCAIRRIFFSIFDLSGIKM